MARLIAGALALLLCPTLASAQPARRCDGHDLARAAESRERARERYHYATRRQGYVDPAAIREALDAAEAQCDAGDDRGLVYRAAALLALARHAESARDLDEYLSRHPMESHDERQRVFLRELSSSLEGSVARVTVQSGLPGATVRVVDAVVSGDGRVHYVEPGVARVEVSASDYEPARRTLPFTAGRHTLGVGDASRSTPPSVGELHVDLRPLAPVLPVTTAPTPAMVTLAPRPQAREHPLRPWALGAAVGAGAFVVLGVAFTAWHQSSLSTYEDQRCVSLVPVSETCRSLYDEERAARGLQVASFITAGVLAAGAVTLWVLDRRAGSRRASMTGCSLALPGGVRCSF